MNKNESVIQFTNVIRNYANYKGELIEKLKLHVNKNLIHFQNVSRETKEEIANIEKNQYLCFDTESCKDFNDNEKERVWCWSLSNTMNDIVIYGYTIDDFIEFMKDVYSHKDFDFNTKAKSKNVNLMMWVHNLSWDIEFFKYWLSDNKYVYYSKILYDDDSVEDEYLDCNSWNIVENNAQVYNATINIKMNDIIFGKKKFKSFLKLKFYDSAKLIPDKLESIGKNIIKIDDMFNKLGSEFDYDYIRPYNYMLSDIEKCYIYNDVYILKEFINQYYIENSLDGYTASGIAFNNLLKFMYPDVKKRYEEFTKKYPEIKDFKALKLIDDSYMGGYTYCNPDKKGKIISKLGHSIDRNSSYPAAMKYEKLPYGKPKYFSGKYVYDSEYDIALQRIHFDGFRRKNKSNLGFIKIGSCCDYLQDIKKFGYKNNDYVSTNFDDEGQLLTYNYNLVFTIDELNLMMAVYDFYTYRRINGEIIKGKKNLMLGLEFVEGVKFKSLIGDFAEFIDDCVYRKVKYKKEHNKCGVTVAKRDMNSVYGKLGSGFTRKIMEYVKDENGFFKYQRKYVNDNEYDYLENRKYYRAFASFTTSYGRIALLSIIIKIEELYGWDEFLYSDTDSIYATLTVEQFKTLGCELDKLKLGAWDIEKEFTKFKCLGAKKYLLWGHEYEEKQSNSKDQLIPHCAGLTESSQKLLTFDNFYLGAEFTKKQKKKVIGGYRLENIKFTLKEFSFYR
jgi:hypothetical protein